MSGQTDTTACVLIIGNEILSGKTQDANLRFFGLELARLGIRLAEARVIRDEHATIIDHVNACRTRFSYVFTTGGIGPTHDDITAEAVARAFDVELILNEEAVARLRRSGGHLNEARLKMARMPAGAELIDNPISHAPGFRIANVFVLAGIPSIARAMFASAARRACRRRDDPFGQRRCLRSRRRYRCAARTHRRCLARRGNRQLPVRSRWRLRRKPGRARLRRGADRRSH